MKKREKMRFVLRESATSWRMPNCSVEGYEKRRIGLAKRLEKKKLPPLHLEPWQIAFEGTETDCLCFLNTINRQNMGYSRKAILVPIETIKAPLDYCPRARPDPPNHLTFLENLALNDAQFFDSVRRFGLVRPLRLTPDLQIIDGYRRLFACQYAGFKHVLAYYAPPLVEEKPRQGTFAFSQVVRRG